MHLRNSFLVLALFLSLGFAARAQEGPHLVNVTPVPESTVVELRFINVIFNDAVFGINASDLVINATPASSIVTNNPNDYTFYFSQPPTGAVQIAWALNHGITGYQQPPDPFVGEGWSYILDTNSAPRPVVVLSEFMADNENGVQDEDGTRSDWIEILNRGPVEANLSGWYLTDDRLNLTKWRFPAGMSPLNVNGYLRVWASEKDRRAPLGPLHTSFRLSNNAGSFLALVDPQTNIVSTFDPYPAQQDDISYGRDRVDPNIVGYFSAPTPGAPNTTSGSGFSAEPTFSLETGVYTNSSVTLTMTAPPGATIRYTRDGTIPTTLSLLYTNSITLSNNSTIKARVFQTGLLPSRVGARTFIFLDGTTANFTSNLPLMIISTEGRTIAANVAPGAARTRGSLVVIDTFRGRSSLRGKADYHGFAEFEEAGQTSASGEFRKRPYRFETQDAMLNDEPASLLGLPAESDWRLRNPYNDKTLLNDFMAFELFEKLGHYSVRRKFVEVFVDSNGGRLTYPADYMGVEVLAEHIKVDNDRVDIDEITPQATNAPAVTGGYIFKKDKDSNGDLNFNTAGGAGFGGQALKLHEPKPNAMRNNPGVTTSWPGPGYTPSGSNQMSYLVSYLNRMEGAMYAANWLSLTGTNHYSHYLDVDSFVDMHWMVEFTKQIDGYRLSSFFTKPRNGKVINGPIWDWNLAYGNANYLHGGLTNGWYFADQTDGMGSNEHIWLRRLINGSANMGAGNTLTPGGDPDFNQKIADRWTVLRTNQCDLTKTIARIDELSTMLSEAAARDLYGKYRVGLIGVYTWPNPAGTGVQDRDVNYVTPTNYLGSNATSIIWQMKKWMTGRYNWIDSQFTRIPTFNVTDGPFSNALSVTIAGPVGAAIYYTLDGTDPRGSGGVTNGTRYTGPIAVNANTRLVARAKMSTSPFYNTWSGPAAVTLYNSAPALRITEIMYHPAPPPAGSTNTDEDFEYIEVKNTGATPLNVNRFELSGGVSFQFPNVVLQPGQCAVVVANLAAFQSRYGTSILVLGTYTGSLNNAGDHVVLSGSVREPILDFTYSDEWYPTTDGSGFALTIVNPNAARDTWGLATSWRAGSALNGSPGQDDPAVPGRPGIVISEVSTHTDPPAVDTIELHNPTAGAVNIGGWFLSDSFNNPKKFIIPATNIAAGGYVTFTEAQFGGTNGFGLSSFGDDVWLFSGDGVNLTGYAHGYSFGAAANGVTFGRVVTSVGADHLVSQTAATLGTANSGPIVGPIIVSEIHYRPLDVTVGNVAYNNGEDEYVELRNISSSPVQLFDPAYPTNTWRLRDAVDFEFPMNVTLPAGGGLLVVSFDPANAAELAAFRARNGVPPSVPVFGPFRGQLDNSGEPVELERPDVPEPPISGNPGFVPYLLVERVSYSNVAPWPAAADGIGLSLQRSNPSGYGNDPINWAAGGPTPGTGFTGGTPPVITAQPTNTSVVAYYAQTSFRVTVADPTGVRYQWKFGDLNIPGGTNATLVLSNVQPSQAGQYYVVAYNGAGATISSNATLTVLVPVSIISQPTSLALRGSNDVVNYGRTFSNATFTVQASSGNPPVTYQWYRDGAIIPGATGPTFTVPNATLADEGIYRVNVSDAISTAPSADARLSVLIAPFITQQLQGQTVVEGTPVTLQLGVRGNPTPFGYRFRRTGVNLTNVVTSQTTAAITLPSVRTNEAGTYTVIVTNGASFQPGVLSGNAYLTVVVPPTNQVADSGANVAFSVAAFGTGATTYQWRFNGTDLPGATNSTLVVTNAQASGIYSVVVNVAANAGTPPIAPATFSAMLTLNGQVTLASPQRLTDGSFRGVLQGAISNEMYVIEVSTNLINWATSSTIRYTNSSTPFTDSAATNSPRRFYRARLP